MLYEHYHPHGFINEKIIKGITQTKKGFYIIDIAYNHLLITEETFNELSLMYPIKKCKRKGV